MAALKRLVVEIRSSSPAAFSAVRFYRSREIPPSFQERFQEYQVRVRAKAEWNDRNGPGDIKFRRALARMYYLRYLRNCLMGCVALSPLSLILQEKGKRARINNN